MARRNREVNIFNMSLLDILCGALGAFCFMMLASMQGMEKYKPDNPSAQQREKELKEQLDELSKFVDKLGEPGQVKDLTDLHRRLEQRFRQLQADLNYAQRERDRLQEQAKELSAQLKLREQELQAANKQREKDVEQLLKQLNDFASKAKDAGVAKDLTDLYRQLEEKFKQLQTALGRTELERDNLQKQVEALIAKLKTREHELHDSERARKTAEDEANRQAAMLKDLRAKLDAALAALQKSENQRADLESRLAATRERLQATEAARMKAETRAQNLEAENKNLQDRIERADQSFQKSADTWATSDFYLLRAHSQNNDWMLDIELIAYIDNKHSKDYPLFDPRVYNNNGLSKNQIRQNFKTGVDSHCAVTFRVPRGYSFKLYYSQYGLLNDPDEASYAIKGYLGGRDFLMRLPLVSVSRERPWILVGTITLDESAFPAFLASNVGLLGSPMGPGPLLAVPTLYPGRPMESRPRFIAASQRERDEEWRAVNERIKNTPPDKDLKPVGVLPTRPAKK